MKRSMPDKLLFEYAVVRVVPRVEREEFLNVGVVLFCTTKKFLKVRYTLPEARLQALCPHVAMVDIHEHLQAFERICGGGDGSGPIGKLTIAERFRWLTATRSTIVQTSRVHPGLCDDPQQMLDKLFLQLVAEPEAH